MPDEVKLITSEINRSGRESRSFYDSVLRELASLNKDTERATARLYDGVLGMLVIHPSTGIPENSIENLNRVGSLLKGLQPIHDKYRRVYGALARSYREEGLGLVADKEERIGKLLTRLGVDDDRVRRKGIAKDTYQVVNAIHVAGLEKINSMLEKWRAYVYDSFHYGVIKGLQQLEMRKMFYNDNGTIRVGSSLDEESVYAAMTSVTEQRTAYQRNEAKKAKMTYCWNFNPMDFRTKEECLEATMAGVIPEGQMSMEHGFPPRHICRCDVSFTRGEWNNVNSAVNRAIDDRRQKLFLDMSTDPSSFQKSKWKVNGNWVYPQDDIARLQGNKYYKVVNDKLDVLADPVPDFDADYFDLPGTSGGAGGLPAQVPQAARSQMSKRQLNAVDSYVPSNKASRTIAEKVERQLAAGLDAEHVVGKRPFDLFVDNEFVEVKTFISGRGQIRMRPASKLKKTDFAKKYNVRPHTVLVDKRPDSDTFDKMFYRRGLGDFTTSTMTEVKDYDHLRLLLKKGSRTPDVDVPSVTRLKASGDVHKAENWAKRRLGIEDVDYDEIDADAADMINKYLGGATDKLGVKPKAVTWDDAKFTGKNRRAFALADENGTITINRKYFQTENGMKNMMQNSYDIKHFGTSSEGHIIRHEMGHIDYFNKGGTEALANRKLTGTMKKQLKDIGPENLDKYVSKYARGSQGEFFAETVAKELNGERLHPVVKKMKGDIERNIAKAAPKKAVPTKGLAAKLDDFDLPDKGTPYAMMDKLEKKHINHITVTLKKGQPIKAGTKTHKVWEAMDDNDKLTYLTKWEKLGLDVPDHFKIPDAMDGDDILSILKGEPTPKAVKVMAKADKPDVDVPTEGVLPQDLSDTDKDILNKIVTKKTDISQKDIDIFNKLSVQGQKDTLGFWERMGYKVPDEIITGTPKLKKVVKKQVVGLKQPVVNETMFTTTPYSEMTKLEKQHINHITYTLKKGKPIGEGTKTHSLWNKLAVDKQMEFNDKWEKLGLDVPDYLKAGKYKNVVDVDVPKATPKTTLPPPHKLTDADYTKVDNAWSKTLKANGGFKEAVLFDANEIGGMHTKHWVIDVKNDKWLFKPYTREPWRAEADEWAYKMARLVDPDALEVRVVKIDGVEGSIQKWIDEASELRFSTSLSEAQVQQLQKEHVIDWLMGNHDAHSDQFVIKNGKIIGIDKGQAGKFMGKDKLDVNYSPNTSQFGAQEPIYNKIYKAAAKGDMKADPQNVLTTIKHVEKINDSDFELAIRPYATRRAQATGESADDIVNMFMQKKHNLRSDYEEFFTNLYNKPFKFVDADDSISTLGEGLTHKALAEEVEDARWLGKVVKGDGEDIEDHAVLNWLEVNQKGEEVWNTRIKLTPNANVKFENMLYDKVPNVASMGDRYMPEDIFFNDVEDALKTIFGHKTDLDFTPTTIEKALTHKKTLEIWADGDSDLAAMSKHYLKYMDGIEEIDDILKYKPGYTFSPDIEEDVETFATIITDLKSQGKMEKFIIPKPTEAVAPTNLDYEVTMRKAVHYEKTMDNGKAIIHGESKSGIPAFSGTDEYVIDFPDGTQVVYRGSAFNESQTGEIIVRKVGGDLEDAKRTLANLGIDLTPPTLEQQEALYLWQNLRAYNLDGVAKVKAAMALPDDAAKVKELQKLLSIHLSVDDVTKLKSYDYTGKTNMFGQSYRDYQRLDNLGEEMADRGYVLKHDIGYGGGKDPDDLLNDILNSGGQISARTDRMRMGENPKTLHSDGASDQSDLQRGGANYFFTRPGKINSINDGIYFKPSVANRVDAHWYTGDSFGDTTDSYRSTTTMLFKKNTIISDPSRVHQVTLKNGMSLWDDVDRWVVDNAPEKNKMIDMMKKHGFTKMPDGRALKDVFVVGN